MQTSANGKDIIKEHEGLRLTTYLDSAGLPTIGWGHLIKPNEGYLLNTTITMQQAEQLLTNDLQAAETAVNTQVIPWKHNLNQNQFDALVSLIFNIGVGAFTSSTVKGRITNGTFTSDEIEEAWKRWNKITLPNGTKVVSPGLVNRRQQEVDLYFSRMSVKKKV